MNTRTRLTATVLASAAIVVATACQQSSPSEEPVTTTAPATTTSATPPPGPPAPAAATIMIDGFTFNDVTVAPGAQITVQNNDEAEHTVTSNTEGAFSVEVAGRSKATFTAPTEPGSYPFHCDYHPSMHGTLTVQ